MVAVSSLGSRPNNRSGRGDGMIPHPGNLHVFQYNQSKDVTTHWDIEKVLDNTSWRDLACAWSRVPSTCAGHRSPSPPTCGKLDRPLPCARSTTGDHPHQSSRRDVRIASVRDSRSWTRAHLVRAGPPETHCCQSMAGHAPDLDLLVFGFR